ncbi:MAG: FkbM family methyltransferase [Candidatus Aminicenantes bacterium]|nr:FkbM family methyltransferase [Candidatus Aminicenantes bacterium]
MIKPKFFSQNGEDYLLWKFFEEKRNGFFVDIGAFDGVHISNTYALELMGWKGICVEPNPEIFELCRKNRPSANCLTDVCIGEKKRRKKKFYIDEIGLLSTTIKNKEKLIDLRQRYKNRGLPFSGLKKVKLKASTFNEILENNLQAGEKIDFVSIDTEGNELDILKGIDFKQYNIRVLVIESDKLSEKEMAELLLEKGSYMFARKTFHNSFFVKDSEDIKRLNSIPINCVIEKQLHPKGLKYTPPDFLKERIIKE